MSELHPRHPVILDHDGGVDDLVALALLATAVQAQSSGCTPIELIGCIVVDADCFAEPAAECCVRLLNLIGRAPRHSLPRDGRPVPVAVSTLQHTVEPFPDEWRKDCINMLDFPSLNHPQVVQDSIDGRFAVRDATKGEDLMARLVLNSEHPVTICVTGPLSNVADCIRRHGEAFTKKVHRVVIMGGAVDVKGNVFRDHLDGSAEWNLYWDCDAAQTVLTTPLLSAAQRILFTLDATNHVPVTSAFVRRFGAVAQEGQGLLPSHLASFLGASFAMCTHFAVLYGDARGYYAWDALTSTFVIDERATITDLEVVDVVVDVDRKSPSIGATKRRVGQHADAEPHGEVSVPRGVKAETFYRTVLECASAV